MDIFMNPHEERLRTLWRLISFFLIAGVLTFPVILAANAIGFPEYIISGLFKVIVIISILLSALVIDKRSSASLGVAFNLPWLRDFGIGMGAAGLSMSLIFVLSLILGWIHFISFGWYQSTFTSGLTFFLAQMILVAFWEELLFRGYLIPNLTEGLRSRKISTPVSCYTAILITSSIFGLAHLNNPNADWYSTLNIILAGVVLAIPFVITGSLAISTGAHFAWNFFQGGIFGFPVSGMPQSTALVNIRETGPDTWTGGAFGPEAGLTGMIGLALMLFIIIIYTRFAGYNMTVNLTLKKSIND